MKTSNILVINPGSTTTKIAVFTDSKLLVEKTIDHDAGTLAGYKQIMDQLPLRKRAVLDVLFGAGVQLSTINCIMARGGLLKQMPGGTYLIDQTMCEELETSDKEHASNLAALIAKELADSVGIKAYITDPVVVDEMEPIARISGLKGVERISIFHALNQKECARKAAAKLGKKYEECNFIIAHLGGGITVGAHKKARVIDVNSALDGDGPFTPERSGSLPITSIINLCFEGKHSKKEILEMIVGKGGLVSYLNTNDGRLVEQMIEQGDQHARLIYEAMAYQIAKEIGGNAVVLKGCVDGIILTGGLAYSKMLIEWIRERVEFIAPIIVFPGENEMAALAAAGLRILNGEEKYKRYDMLNK